MEIHCAKSLTSHDIAGRDFSFEVSSEVAKPYHRLASADRIATIPIPAFTKDYGFDESAFESIQEPDSVLFTLVKDTQVYGYAHASKSWNNMVVLEDIALDVSLRGHGYGRQLLKRVIEWAQQLGVAGIRLESQSNNVAACYFYKKCGFQFAGYDEFLYKGIPKHENETALFWCLIFSPSLENNMTSSSCIT